MLFFNALLTSLESSHFSCLRRDSRKRRQMLCAFPLQIANDLLTETVSANDGNSGNFLHARMFQSYIRTVCPIGLA